ncbi:MAG TPA: hypothetical protein VKE93_04920, partial [Candidatus Angelobacter sp.]|nr:hypothetical protein [Candidatus Angelobacter sp.]
MFPKKFGVISSLALAIVLVLAAIPLARHLQFIAQERVSAAQKPEQQATPEPATLPPGTIVHTAKATTTALFLARQNLTNSSYMTVAEFERAIRDANGGKSTFKKDETALIPGMEQQPIVEKSRPFPKDREVRAIYLTG